MDENEVDLDEPATRRDLKELATRRDLRDLKVELKAELANHPTRVETDASFSQVLLHIESVRVQLSAELAQHANAISETLRVDMSAQLTQQTNAIREDLRSQISGLQRRLEGRAGDLIAEVDAHVGTTIAVEIAEPHRTHGRAGG